MTEQTGLSLDWQSTSIKHFPRLEFGALHLWWLPLTLSHEQSQQALTFLSDIQRDKYHRRASPQLQQSYLAGRYYLMTLLGQYTNCNPEAVKLSYSRLNKPYISNNESTLKFNFTDTHFQDQYFGLFGFCHELEIGVDIESHHRDIDLRRIVERRFTTDEQNFVNDNGSINKHRGLSIWTRKEAYGKAIGKGINFKMNQQNLVSDDYSTDSAFNFKDSQKRKWRCQPLSLGHDFVASCVYEGHKELTISAFNSLHI